MLDAPDTAVLAVNLGTPETPTAPAVRRYLAEFLSDPRVVAIPPILWKPLLYGLILPLRSGRSAAKYAQVWLPDGSPLMVYTRQLAQAMQALMPDVRVRHAMRYGAPATHRRAGPAGCRGHAPDRGAAAVSAVFHHHHRLH